MNSASHGAQNVASVTCAVLTVSDTRTMETDTSGALIRDRLVNAGHVLRRYEIVRDEPDEVATRLDDWLAEGDIQAIFITGGTGIAPRDTTIEVVDRRLDKRLDGFGELFRVLSYEEIGASAMLSRALAGVAGHTAIFAMPGATRAVELAVDKLILPALGHVVGLLRP